MRLIDADRLSENIYGNVPAPYEDSREAKEDCLRAIEEAPTIDAVPVVRCRDCAHLYGSMCAACGLLLRKPDKFCSRGERKDGAGHMEGYND